MPANTLRRQRQAGGQVAVNPRYARWCIARGLETAADFLDLPGEVITGHRDRHVLDVRIGPTRLILKKEHRVSLGTRLANWRAGAGWASLSQREASNLELLKEAGVPVPEWIANGADDHGRAFLLLRRVRARPLQNVLRKSNDRFRRWKLAQAIGVAIARLHRSGMDAPDLSAKHILVQASGQVVLIDWARGRQRVLNRNRCLHPLASLHASLPMEFASLRERFNVLQAWMRTLGFRGRCAPLARLILRLTPLHLRRRSIREQHARQHNPRLLWLQGEALCIGRRFWRSMGRTLPDWLQRAANQTVTRRTETAIGLKHCLIQFPPVSRIRRLCAAIGMRPVQSQGIQQTGLVYRLARHGVPVAPVVAFGGRSNGAGFMLCQLPRKLAPARHWLALPWPERTSMLKRIGQLLRRCHEAGCRGITADNLFIDVQYRRRLRMISNGRFVSFGEITQTQIAADLQSLAQGLGLKNSADVAHIRRGYRKTTNSVPVPLMRRAA